MTARTDVYVRFTDLPVARSRRIGMEEEDVHLDVDVAGNPVGIEILAAASVELDGAPIAGHETAVVAALTAAREVVRGWDDGEWQVGPRGTAAVIALHDALAALGKAEEADRG